MESLADRLNHLSEHDRSTYLEKLVAILVELNSTDKLDRLITDPDWMQLHLNHKGDFESFIDDIDKIWKKTAQEIKNNPNVISKLIHYALLRTIPYLMTASLPSQLIISGLELDLWNSNAAQNYADKLPRLELRVEAMIGISKSLSKQHKPELSNAIALILSMLRKMRQSTLYEETFEQIVPILPVDFASEALNLMKDIQHPERKSKLLTYLAPRLSSDLILEAMPIIDDIKDEVYWAETIVAFIPHVPDTLLNDILEIIPTLSSSYVKTILLIALASFLKNSHIDIALKEAQSIPEVHYSIAATLPYINKNDEKSLYDLLRKAIGSLQREDDPDERARSIKLLASFLPQELLPDLFALALGTGNQQGSHLDDRTMALVALAPYLPPPLQLQVIEDISEWDNIYITGYAEAMGKLAPHLPHQLLSVVLADIRKTVREVFNDYPKYKSKPQQWAASYITEVFVRIVPSLPAPFFKEFLDIVEEIPDEGVRIYTIVKIAPDIPREFIEDAYQIVRRAKFSYGDDRITALAMLSARGFPQIFEEALRLNQNRQENEESVFALPLLISILSKSFSDERRSRLIETALNIVREIQFPRMRAQAFLSMAEYLPVNLLQEVVKEVKEIVPHIEGEKDQIATLQKLLPLSNQTNRSLLVEMILDIGQDLDLNEEYYGEPDSRLLAAATFLPPYAAFLPDDILQETVEAIKEQPKLALRAKAYALAAPYLPNDQRIHVIYEAIQNVKDDYQFSSTTLETLALIASLISGKRREEIIRITMQLIEDRIERSKYSDYRNELGVFLPALIKVLEPHHYQEMLSIARMLVSPEALTELLRIAPVEQHQELLDEAYSYAIEIKDPYRQYAVLSTIASHDSIENIPRSLNKVLEELVHLMDLNSYEGKGDREKGEKQASPIMEVLPVERINVFGQLIPGWLRLPEETAFNLLKQTIYASSFQHRNRFLLDLIGLLPAIEKLGGKEVINKIYEVLEKVCLGDTQKISIPLKRGERP